jgi:hypothetical protein
MTPLTGGAGPAKGDLYEEGRGSHRVSGKYFIISVAKSLRKVFGGRASQKEPGGRSVKNAQPLFSSRLIYSNSFGFSSSRRLKRMPAE